MGRNLENSIGRRAKIVTRIAALPLVVGLSLGAEGCSQYVSNLNQGVQCLSGFLPKSLEGKSCYPPKSPTGSAPLDSAAIKKAGYYDVHVDPNTDMLQGYWERGCEPAEFGGDGESFYVRSFRNNPAGETNPESWDPTARYLRKVEKNHMECDK